MTDAVEQSTREELTNSFETAVEFIGRDWLESQFDEHFDNDPNETVDFRTDEKPDLLIQYHLASVYLGKREEKFPEFLPEGQPNEPALRFTNLGNFISGLDTAGIVTPEGQSVDKSLRDFFSHRLRNPDEYKQSSYEIKVGSIYSQLGHEVSFIEEGKQKAPDILIPCENSEVRIECKRCGMPGDLEKRDGIYQSLINRLTSVSHTPAIFLFDFSRVPTPEEAQKIDEYLPEELCRSTEAEVSVPFGSIRVLPYREYTRTKRIPTAGMDAGEQLEFFYDYYIKPVIYAKTGEELELYEDFERATIETHENKVAISSREADYFDPMFVGLRFDSEDDLITPIVRQFDATSGKFDKEHPNLLHIDVPYLEKLSRDDFVRLHQRLRGKLNVNSRVSAVAVTTEFTEWNENNKLDYTIFCGSEENLDPYIAVPDNFEVPGYSLEEMRDNPMLK